MEPRPHLRLRGTARCDVPSAAAHLRILTCTPRSCRCGSATPAQRRPWTPTATSTPTPTGPPGSRSTRRSMLPRMLPKMSPADSTTAAAAGEAAGHTADARGAHGARTHNLRLKVCALIFWCRYRRVTASVSSRFIRTPHADFTARHHITPPHHGRPARPPLGQPARGS